MEKAHYSKVKFFEKELLNLFQFNDSFLHPLPPLRDWKTSLSIPCPPPLKRLENFANPLPFKVVLKMKYCSEMNYIIKRVTFV